MAKLHRCSLLFESGGVMLINFNDLLFQLEIFIQKIK
jgi:hypothetical protein